MKFCDTRAFSLENYEDSFFFFNGVKHEKVLIARFPRATNEMTRHVGLGIRSCERTAGINRLNIRKGNNYLFQKGRCFVSFVDSPLMKSKFYLLISVT